MNFPPQNWPSSQAPSHSNEIEHRLTVVETVQLERLRINEQRRQDTQDKIDRHESRLNLHEKAILAIRALLNILLQDKYPKIAELLRGLL